MDVLVLPSLWEGLPTVILEGMASQVPVIATDIPGTRELIRHRDTGWLVRPRDPADLASAVLHALRHPDQRAKVVEQASSTVLQKYTMRYIAERYQEHYTALTRKTGHAHR